MYTVTALTPGEDYKFRFVARNALGTMFKPSTLTDKIFPNDEFVASQILFKKKLLDGFFTRNDKTIVLKARVTGKPYPRIWWTKDGAELIPSANMDIEQEGQFQVLTIRDTRRVDSDVYKLFAKTHVPRDHTIMRSKFRIALVHQLAQSNLHQFLVRR